MDSASSKAPKAEDFSFSFFPLSGWKEMTVRKASALPYPAKPHGRWDSDRVLRPLPPPPHSPSDIHPGKMYSPVHTILPPPRCHHTGSAAILDAVKQHYSAVPTCYTPDEISAWGYDNSLLSRLGLPSDLTAAASGGGCPLLIEEIKEGCTVMDLGCGAGHDVVCKYYSSSAGARAPILFFPAVCLPLV
jgi:hypothetical protein